MKTDTDTKLILVGINWMVIDWVGIIRVRIGRIEIDRVGFDSGWN